MDKAKADHQPLDDEYQGIPGDDQSMDPNSVERLSSMDLDALFMTPRLDSSRLLAPVFQQSPQPEGATADCGASWGGGGRALHLPQSLQLHNFGGFEDMGGAGPATMGSAAQPMMGFEGRGSSDDPLGGRPLPTMANVEVLEAEDLLMTDADLWPGSPMSFSFLALEPGSFTAAGGPDLMRTILSKVWEEGVETGDHPGMVWTSYDLSFCP